ncbi:MFS transporter [Pseudonocardia sp. ICBG1293]|uniref:MFS transporter n=1 Tax=Pseudonocardia sp. ICBG1293 TaxID=2844382 RepID=UPI001CC9ED1C|nr:MFS transporter [Pseudonocardia sp. ICBG1293]
MSAPLARTVAPLRRPAYRALLASLTCSLLATGAWTLALIWQVLDLGGGPVEVSVVGATGSAFAVVTFLLGGVLADRVPARRLLTGVEAVRACSTGAVALASVSGHLTLVHLVLAAAVQGVGTALYMPSYSALLVRVLEPSELPVANSIEGMLRPVTVQALGPAAAGALVAVWSPAAAVAAAACAAVAAAVAAARLPHTDPDPAALSESLTAGLRGGLRHVVRTRWLLTTLLYSSVATLVVMGPMALLTPFAVRDSGGGPAEHALVLAALGIGAAAGSAAFLVVAPPRRHLSAMMVLWALACLPLAVFGTGAPLWLMVTAGFVVGTLFNAPMVIWGTLLQQRVPRALLGRVSGLDFFVSLGLLPVSMALAGPVGSAIGLQATFLGAAMIPAVLAVVAVLAGRLRAEESAHPLEVSRRTR